MEIIELMIKDNYDPNEEFYAYETKDKKYIDFLKRTNQYTEEKKGVKKWKQQNKKEQSENSKQK